MKKIKSQPSEIERLIAITEKYFRQKDLLAKSRKEDLVYARDMAIVIAYRLKLGGIEHICNPCKKKVEVSTQTHRLNY